ncbi:ATP-binding protein [bacterium]|nr:ATP-binding protein [bacterium]
MKTGELPHARYLSERIRQDLQSKMVLLGGPRQVGKTTLALSLLAASDAEQVSVGGPQRSTMLPPGDPQHPAYLNWDFMPDKSGLIGGNIPADEPLIILDEIHKYPQWRSLVKGLYDTYRSRVSFLITGSARLDYYTHGGDSLDGRYFFYRLHPFSLAELDPHYSRASTELLLRFGGFPEPLLRGEEEFSRRWHKQRSRRVIQDDLTSLEEVKSVELVKLLADLLPSKVGSPLSIRSLREDLQVAYETVQRWIGILENLFFCFRISPYGPPKIRAIKKEQKLYLWDWSLCTEQGPRFENFVASQLLKYCHAVEDTNGYHMELRFLREVTGKEIDFVVLKEGKPLFAVECKNRQHEIDPSIKYFAERSDIPQFYQVHLGEKDYENAEHRIRVLPFEKFARILGLP